GTLGSERPQATAVTFFAQRAQVKVTATGTLRRGAMPARKSLVIATWAVTPNMMTAMEGGITGAITPPDAISPAALGTPYPAFRIIGISSAATAAESATAEPERLAIKVAARMAT